MTQAKTDVKTGSRLVCRPCDSWNLNKTSVREKSRGCYLPKGSVFLSFSELFDNISPVRSVKCPTPRPIRTIKSPAHALIYKNRVSKNFVISLYFPGLSLFPVLFAYVVFSWLFCGWVFCQCRSGCRQNFPNFYPTFSSVPLCMFFFSL